MKHLTFAVIHDGFCIFGAGATEEEACLDASQWLGPRVDGQISAADMIKTRCKEDKPKRDLRIISRAGDMKEFDSYMENQGGYEFDGIGWVINPKW